MSRSTQYIGLNKYAHELVKDAIKTETYEMTTGMFVEPVNGRIYHMAKENDLDVASIRYVEIVQTSPWSSGPMIFTHLRREWVKNDGTIEPEEGEMYCSWMLDPALRGQEYDYETGRYYV